MLKIFAPAKINLHLHVTGKRPDGYHLLDSLVCFTDIGDQLIFEPSIGFQFDITGPFADHLLAGDKSAAPSSGNSVVKAAWTLANSVGRELNVRITLQKNLPPGGGIGGGSADAAACFWGLAQFWNLHLPDNYFHMLALKIGSDVPVCLKSQAVVMQGIGDQFKPAPELPEIPIVLVWPNKMAPTPEVYKSLAMKTFSDNFDFRPSYKSSKDLIGDLAAFTRNDLAGAASGLFPVIAQAEKLLKTQDHCLFARMSGSGSTVFGLFESDEDAQTASEKILEAHPDWWVRHGWLNRIARY